MGQYSSSTIPSEHARLIFAKNGLRNTQIQCDALGIHYQLLTPTEGFKTQRLTSITRWDSRQEEEVLIAEWERKFFGKDRIRIVSNPLLISEGPQSEDRFVLVTEFLQRTKGIAGAVRVNRTFTANNGRRYTWEARYSSLKLYEEGSEIPMAEYKERRYLSNKRPAHIRLAPGCDEILDYIIENGLMIFANSRIVTCVITERKRRDAKQRQRSGGGGGGGGGGDGGG